MANRYIVSLRSLSWCYRTLETRPNWKASRCSNVRKHARRNCSRYIGSIGAGMVAKV